MGILPTLSESRDIEPQTDLVVASDWLIQPCSVPGCSVVIRSRAGKQSATLPVCKWCQAGNAYYRKATSPPQSHGGMPMDLDEFGRDLYDAIVLRSTSVMASNGAKRMRAQGYHQAASQAEDAAQRADAALHALLDKGILKPQDVRRLLSIQ
jgi:hypothetical protein